MQRLFPYLAAMVLVGMSVVAAVAHAFLNQAVPPVGGTVAASPPEIRLYFSEAIEPRFSGIELTSLDGRPVKTGPSTRVINCSSCCRWSRLSPPVATRSLGTSSLPTTTQPRATSPSRSNRKPELGAKSWVRC